MSVSSPLRRDTRVPASPPVARAVDASLIKTRQLHPHELGAAEFQAWLRLEARSVEPNAYLSPHFVMPAVQYLDPGRRPLIVAAEHSQQGELEWLGMGVFHNSLASRLCPVPHWVGYLSRHSYLNGLLADADHVDAVVESLIRSARSGAVGRHALVLPKLQIDGPVAQACERWAARARLPTRWLGRQDRAMMTPAKSSPDSVRQALGKRFNEVERCKRRMAEQGEVSWNCLRDDVDEAAVEDFLRLEHQGWKADVGTSLRANPADEAFFKAVTAGFASEGRALFTELRVGDRVVASTSNYVSGGMGFAFKVGWEQEMRKFGPGLVNEVEFMRVAARICPDLTAFDSGASADSFINKLWTERRELGTLVVPLSRRGRSALDLLDTARAALRRLRKSGQKEDAGQSTQALDP